MMYEQEAEVEGLDVLCVNKIRQQSQPANEQEIRRKRNVLVAARSMARLH